MRRVIALGAVLLSLSAAEVRAGQCVPPASPFTDVPDTSIFCSEALWMRNALVTTGCGTTTFCPNDPVTRAQMALFMKRLARAVRPDSVFESNPSTAGDLDVGYETCVTQPYSIPATGANYRSLGPAIGTVSILTNGPADIYVSIEISTNGGPYLTMGINPQRVQVAANTWTAVTPIAGQTITNGSGALLAPGSTYRWRILLQRASFATTGDVTSNRCQLLITLPVDATVQ